MKQKINLIVAIQKPGNGIGIGNDLLYKIKEDMEYFKEKTLGSVVIMGRKTWDSIPTLYRPLPNRVNVIISKTLKPDPTQNFEIYDSFEKALGRAMINYPSREIFVMGGSSLYKAALPYADFLHATEIQGNKKAEIFFPDYSNLRETTRSETLISKSGIKFAFVLYENPQKVSFQ